jgi:hypothetical protein
MKYAAFALKALALIAVTVLIMGYVRPQPEPTPTVQQVEQLRADMKQLRADMTAELEEVRNVQGYMIRQATWEDEKWGKGAGQ